MCGSQDEPKLCFVPSAGSGLTEVLQRLFGLGIVVVGDAKSVKKLFDWRFNPTFVREETRVKNLRRIGSPLCSRLPRFRFTNRLIRYSRLGSQGFLQNAIISSVS